MMRTHSTSSLLPSFWTLEECSFPCHSYGLGLHPAYANLHRTPAHSFDPAQFGRRPRTPRDSFQLQGMRHDPIDATASIPMLSIPPSLGKLPVLRERGGVKACSTDMLESILGFIHLS